MIRNVVFLCRKVGSIRGYFCRYIINVFIATTYNFHVHKKSLYNLAITVHVSEGNCCLFCIFSQHIHVYFTSYKSGNGKTCHRGF